MALEKASSRKPSWTLPSRVWKGDNHPFRRYNVVSHFESVGRECITKEEFEILLRKGYREGLGLDARQLNPISYDYRHGEHTVSTEIDPFLLNTSLSSIAKMGGENTFKGRVGLFNWCLAVHAVLMTGGMEGFSGSALPFQIYPYHYAMMKQMQFRADLGHGTVYNWDHVLRAYSYYLISKETGKLDALRGFTGQVSIALDLGIDHIADLYNAENLLGLDSELGHHGYMVSAKDVREFLDKLASQMSAEEFVDGARGKISIRKVIDYFKGKPVDEFSKIREILVTGKLPKAVKPKPQVTAEPESQPLTIELIIKNRYRYKGNYKMMRAAERMGLYFLWEVHEKVAEADPTLTEFLGWECLDAPVHVARALFDELGANCSQYAGDDNQVKLAEKAGIPHLRQLYFLVKAFGFDKRLNYTQLDLVVDDVRDSWDYLIRWADQNKVPHWRVAEALTGKTRKELLKTANDLVEYRLPEAMPLLNDSHKTFDDVLEELGGKAVADLRTLPVEDGEEKFAEEYSSMSNAELEDAFSVLVSGESPLIPGLKNLLHAAFPLIAFLDLMGSSAGEFKRLVNSPIVRLDALRNGYKYEEQSAFSMNDERRGMYKMNAARALRYKAFMRELIKRWGRQG